MIEFENLTRVQKTKWAKQVKDLYNYTCVNCGRTDKSKYMHAHHIVPKYECPEEYKNALENGVALCRKCHRQMHGENGRIPNFPNVRKIQEKIYNLVENEKILSCILNSHIADDFIQYAQDHGTTPSALIKSYVLQCLGRSEEPEPPEN